MAEGLLREAVKGRGDVTVASAGVGTVHGQPPSTHSVEVLRPLGIDITRIRSQPLSEELVEKATHIFAMTRGHLETIQLVFPEAADKTFLVCETLADPGDLADWKFATNDWEVDTNVATNPNRRPVLGPATGATSDKAEFFLRAKENTCRTMARSTRGGLAADNSASAIS